MPRALSLDLRERIVDAYRRGEGTIAGLSRVFNINKRTIDKFLAIERASGDLTPGKAPGRAPKITREQDKVIREMIGENPDKILREYCDIFFEKTGIRVGTSIMDRAFKRLDIRRKKKSYYAAEQDRPDVKKKRRFYSSDGFIRSE